MSQAKVFVFAPVADDGKAHQNLQGNGCELILGKASWDTPQGNSEGEMVAMARGCDALMGTSIRNAPISRAIMESSDRLRIVAKYTIGTDDVDVDAATDLGILVAHSPTESNWGGVAEGAISNMLTLLKKSRERDRYLKTTTGWRDMKLQGTFVGYREEDGYPGITLGIIGLGRIGSRIAKLMRPWGMKMIGYDPYVADSKFQQLGVERVADLPTLLKQADVVTLHVVLTKETRHMINAETLAMMKPSAILINTSRGFCVDEKAVADALLNNTIAGAALDVFETEPIAADSPFRKMDDRVLISPHMISSNHGSGLKTGLLWGTQSVISALKGEVSPYVYNTEVIDQWKARFGGKSIL
jgi:D-3-phosphoglycerate dehydrogenase